MGQEAQGHARDTRWRAGRVAQVRQRWAGQGEVAQMVVQTTLDHVHVRERARLRQAGQDACQGVEAGRRACPQPRLRPTRAGRARTPRQPGILAQAGRRGRRGTCFNSPLYLPVQGRKQSHTSSRDLTLSPSPLVQDTRHDVKVRVHVSHATSSLPARPGRETCRQCHDDASRLVQARRGPEANAQARPKRTRRPSEILRLFPLCTSSPLRDIVCL